MHVYSQDISVAGVDSAVVDLVAPAALVVHPWPANGAQQAIALAVRMGLHSPQRYVVRWHRRSGSIGCQKRRRSRSLDL